ncbi:MAG: Rrf2 family transcriptional regulator [Eubacterium sp.]|nr:Rrf2 family transcriptional regulator [Eubacterium sp.]
MKISKKSRYGITALIDLAINSKDGHVALSHIAERNGISLQYLEQVFAGLRRVGIIKSIKGAQGGYLLNKPSKSITVAEIIEALDGTYHIDSEEGTKNSENPAIAITLQTRIIDKVNEEMDAILLNITLDDLVNDYKSNNEFNEQMYYI